MEKQTVIVNPKNSETVVICEIEDAEISQTEEDDTSRLRVSGKVVCGIVITADDVRGYMRAPEHSIPTPSGSEVYEYAGMSRKELVDRINQLRATRNLPPIR